MICSEKPCSTAMVCSFMSLPCMNHGRYVNSTLSIQSTIITHRDVALILGWVDDFASEEVSKVSKAYIKRDDHNIIILDWGQYSAGLLSLTVIRASIISKKVGRALVELFQLGLDADKFHCVGHSIGGEFSISDA